MRHLRCIVPGITYHLIPRFVDRGWFFTNDEQREQYLWFLGKALLQSDWRCTSYALMSSHIHLLLVAGHSPLASWAKRAHTPFAMWMNEQHDRIGPLFVRGPKDLATPPAAIGAVIAYIHNNPVRAGVAANAAASDWTSHRAYLGRAPRPSWLHVELGYEQMGLDVEQFEQLVAHEPEDPCRPPRVRRTSRHGQIELGTPTGTHPPAIPIMTRPVARLRVDPRWFTQVAASLVGIDESRLCSRSRQRAVVGARRAVVHAGRRFGIANADLAAVLAISGAAVCNILLVQLDDSTQQLCDHIIERVGTLTGVREDRPQSR